ncbi:Acyl-protein thioesterase 1 [Candida viswanathii]|uniref:Acyl-protein thioesterase 1 n=1 Tax=Candida viswanathii TaxID=5486 RepID=A0A367YI49_9ASCO|nr:Acyl-protein thioesterase 1 [Candida viswanathii]
MAPFTPLSQTWSRAILVLFISLLAAFFTMKNNSTQQQPPLPEQPASSSDPQAMSVSAIRIPANGAHGKAALIFIHGLGDTGQGWSWLPQLIVQSKLITTPINYVFPNAPEIPITVNNGFRMPAWFDIYEFGNPNAKQDVEGFFKSCDILKSLVKQQIEEFNIPPEKIIIGGFSQGAAISLATTAIMDTKIGGCIALSGFCPVRKEVQAKKLSANFDTPIFEGHGTADPVINYDYGKLTSEFYKELGFKDLRFHTYPGVAHSASDEELIDVVRFIKQVLEK